MTATSMLFTLNTFQLTDVVGFSFELSSSFFDWIAYKIAWTSIPFLISQTFELSDFELLRVDC